MAFLAGSLLHPVTLTSKKLSRSLLLAENAGASSTPAPFDQQSLDNLPNITLPAAGNIDYAGVKRGAASVQARRPSLGPGDSVDIRGWVADPVAHDRAGGLFLIVDNERRIDVSDNYGAARPDVAAYLHNDRLKDTGFDIVLPGATLAPGQHQLELGVVASDQRGFFKFPDRVTVTVKER